MTPNPSPNQFPENAPDLGGQDLGAQDLGGQDLGGQHSGGQHPQPPREPEATAEAKTADRPETLTEPEATAEAPQPMPSTAAATEPATTTRPAPAAAPQPATLQAADQAASPASSPAANPASSPASRQAAEREVRHQSAIHTRRGFLGATAGVLGGFGLLHWLNTSPVEDDLRLPLRRALDFNASLSRGLTRDHALTPTYPLRRAVDLRVNGIAGLKQDLVPESYRLQLVGVENPRQYPQYVPDVTAWQYRYAEARNLDQGHDTKTDPAKQHGTQPGNGTGDETRPQRGNEEAGESDSTLKPNTPGLLLTLAEATRFARQELVTQFKCIEGWSEIVHWSGVRLADLLDAYPPARNLDGSLPRYVYMETPNGDYYCGFDLHVCHHPQSLLVTEMAGRPLTTSHGAPLRLHMPVKYGYKQIKRIGLIAYTDDKPDDYWTKLGYDWYAGL